MIEILLTATLTCDGSQELIERINKSRVDNKADLIEVVKMNTESTCYERPEHNS
tara:strand:- start:397 stop:558 length:162 start_codon:yes stop_codon:yes gene_type:complete